MWVFLSRQHPLYRHSLDALHLSFINQSELSLQLFSHSGFDFTLTSVVGVSLGSYRSTQGSALTERAAC